MTLPASISTTLAADKVLQLVHLGGWVVDQPGTVRFRAWLDMGTVHIPTGTAGSASVRGALYILESGDPDPTSAAANDYGHSNMTIIRNATYDTSYPLGSAIIDEAIVDQPAGTWEVWGAVVVNSVGDLNGVTVSGTSPSGIIEVLPTSAAGFGGYTQSI